MLATASLDLDYHLKSRSCGASLIDKMCVCSLSRYNTWLGVNLIAGMKDPMSVVSLTPSLLSMIVWTFFVC